MVPCKLIHKFHKNMYAIILRKNRKRDIANVITMAHLSTIVYTGKDMMGHQDSSGTFIEACYTVGNNVTSALETELQAFLIALRHCWAREFTKVLWKEIIAKWLTYLIQGCCNLDSTTGKVKYNGGYTNLKKLR